MPATACEIDEMAEKKAPKTQSVKLTEGAMSWARIASGYTGESIAEYISRIVEDHARLDAERLHAEKTGRAWSKPDGGKPGRKP